MEKTSQPRISVVIPAYNEEKYLPKTLTSIKNLTVPPDEILVVNGDSTDATARVAASFGARVLTISHDGIGRARQKGLEAAKGDIVAYTDADTQVPPDWLDKIVASLTTPGVSGVYGGYNVANDGPFSYRFFINYVNPFLMITSRIFGLETPGGQNIAFWKEQAIKAGGFPIEFKSVEDFEMVRRLKTVGNVVFRWDNFVTSSARRGKEGFFPLSFRVTRGILTYLLTGKADTFDFPTIR